MAGERIESAADEKNTAVNDDGEPTTGAQAAAATGSSGKVRAWDLPTRLFHWTLAALILSAFVTNRFGDDELFWHRLNGYSILTLVLFRVFWGFIGGSTARFKSFICWPWSAARYGLDFARGRPRPFLGHNPLGGWMVFLLLASLTFQGVTGLFSNDDALAEGPLVDLVSYDMSAYLSKLHLRNFDLLLTLIGLHIAANFLYLFWKKINLIGPMVSGVKAPENFEDESEARFGSPLLALLCLLAAAACVTGAIKLAGGNLL